MLNQSVQLIYGKYIWKQNIQTGSFGEISLAEYQGKQLIIKKIDIKDYKESETKILEKIQHPNVVKFFGVDLRKDYVLILTEYCDKKDIMKFQKNLENGVYKEKEALKAFYQILLGVQALHQNNVLHRDIKPANIFIKEEDGELVYKIGDFGQSIVQDIGKSRNIGTNYFEAPELWTYNENGQVSYTKQIDIWALGVTLFYMLNSIYPFSCDSIKKEEDVQTKCRPFKYSRFVDNSNELLEDMFMKIFVINPVKRITIDHLILHPIFKEIAAENTLKYSRRLSLSGKNPNHPPPNPLVSRPSLPIAPSFENINVDEQRRQVEQRMFSEVRQKYLRQRQINNIFMALIQDLKSVNTQYFEPTRFVVFYYNLLKLYLINHFKIRVKLNNLKTNSLYQNLCASIQFKEFYNKIQSQLTSTYQLLLLHHQVCKFKQAQINQQFKNRENIQIIFQNDITESEFSGNFKLFFRLSSGKCYQNLSNKSNSDQNEIIRMKFRLLLCHGVTRIFDNHRRYFQDYYKWAKEEQLKTEKFKEWIKNESIEKIDKCLESIKKDWTQ